MHEEFALQYERRWLKRYEDRIVIRGKQFLPPIRSPQSSADMLRPTTMGDAMIDLLLLGRCARIVGTYYSSFAKVAAIWFHVPYAEIRGLHCFASDFVNRLQGRAV